MLFFFETEVLISETSRPFYISITLMTTSLGLGTNAGYAGLAPIMFVVTLFTEVEI
jgi:hypothetical protein